MARVMMKDIAAHAGVSKATVSRVVNNDPNVAPELRTRVLKAIQELGYQPNRAAQRLRAGSSDVIGLMVSDIQNPFFTSVVGGVEEMAYAHQMSILLCNTNEDYSRQQMYFDVLQAEQVAGLILVPTPLTDAKSFRRLTQANIPTILLDRRIDGLDTDAVVVDNARGAYLAVKHLIELGHSRIAMIAISATLTTGRERQQGYYDAMNEAGLPIEARLIKVGAPTGDSREDDGYHLTRELMQAPNPPGALFVSNNMITLGTLRALRELNIRVPQDLAVVSFDDMPWSAELCPPLTAIAQPTYDLGREAVHLLIRRLAEPKAPYRTVTLQTRLIVRESSGATLRQAR
jgi:LacI family transcriptional regulator